MKHRPGKTDIKFWEYPWYVLVTLFLLGIGVIVALIKMLTFMFRLFRKPVLSWRNAILVMTVVLICSGAYSYFLYTNSTDLGPKVVAVTINAGDGFQQVSQKLSNEGVIDSPNLLNFLAKCTRLDRKLIPGEYSFSGRNSVRSVLARLQKAEGVQVRVTIVEGAPIWKVASILAQQLKTDSAQLLSLAQDRRFLDSLGVPSLEGYLYPETYLFAPKTDLRSIVVRMVQMFLLQTHNLFQNFGNSAVTRDQIVKLASIVQAESKRTDENGKIASVYANRLRLGMTLDADPTVIYGLGGLDRPLTRNDLDALTPYNTYRVAGLPPTPINSPGLAALQAAVRPDSTGYLFFVADGTGAHIFSYTNDEHNMARRHVKLMEKRQ